MKKFMSLLVSLFGTFCFAFSEEIISIETISGKTESSKIRLELNISDCGFIGASYGNLTDVSFDVKTKNNKLGGRVGFIFREAWLMSSPDNFGFNFTPYVGFDFFNGCLSAGIVPFKNDDGIGGCSPYVGINWNFNIFKENIRLHDFSLRVGADWYLDMLVATKTKRAAMENLLFSIIPKAYVGVNYKFQFRNLKSN